MTVVICWEKYFAGDSAESMVGQKTSNRNLKISQFC